MEGKDRILASMLQSNTPTGKKIVDITDTTTDGNKSNDENLARTGNTSTGEEPTMLELMMSAHASAKKEEEKRQTKENDAALSTGFKKGFFSASTKTVKPKQTSTPRSATPTQKAAKSSESDIPTITKKADTSLVIDDVQTALTKDEHPIFQQLKGGGWITEDLKSKISGNKVLLNGMSNPKCMAAIELMQKDPKEAKKRFESDPEVTLFMNEFGKVMSEHFFTLSERQGKSDSSNQSSNAITKPVQEIGPLQAAAVKKSSNPNALKSTSEVNDEHVKKILEDEELRGMLLDPSMQQILQECGDPIKFQRHMQNPATATKITKLYNAGLVGTTK